MHQGVGDGRKCEKSPEKQQRHDSSVLGVGEVGQQCDQLGLNLGKGPIIGEAGVDDGGDEHPEQVVDAEEVRGRIEEQP